MTDDLIQRLTPSILEIGAYEGIALILEALNSPLSSPIAWFGCAIALVRLFTLASKAYHEHKMNKIKLDLMNKDSKELEKIRNFKNENK